MPPVSSNLYPKMGIDSKLDYQLITEAFVESVPAPQIEYSFAKAMLESMLGARDVGADSMSVGNNLPLTYQSFFPGATAEQAALANEAYGNLTVQVNTSALEPHKVGFVLTSDKVDGTLFQSEIITSPSGNDEYIIYCPEYVSCNSCSEFFLYAPEGNIVLPLQPVEEREKIHGYCAEWRKRITCYMVACDRYRSTFTQQDLESEFLRIDDATLQKAFDSSSS
jgi:hypothetical protein